MFGAKTFKRNFPKPAQPGFTRRDVVETREEEWRIATLDVSL